jgi:hypothetical protein
MSPIARSVTTSQAATSLAPSTYRAHRIIDRLAALAEEGSQDREDKLPKDRSVGDVGAVT